MVADPLESTVLAWLGTYVVHSTVLLLAAWCACLFVSRRRTHRDVLPALREGLWRVALLGGLATTSVQVALDGAPAGALWTIERAPELHATPSDAVESARSLVAFDVSAPERAGEDAQSSVPALLVPLLAPFANAFVPRAIASSSVPPASAATDIPSATSALSWPRALLALWLLGVAAGAALWTREWFALGRSLRRRLRLERGPAYDVFAQLCARTGTRGVRLSCAPGLAAPIALGLWHPEIVIPPRALVQLAPDELEALFAHELAHVRRDDALWLVVYRALEVVFFFQPLNRAARVRLQDEAELLADDWAVTQLPARVSLASCLTEIAGWIVDGRRTLPAPGMAARGTRLTLRVRRLLDDEHHPERARRPNAFLILAGSLAGGAALFVPGVAAQAPLRTDEPQAAHVLASRDVEAEAELATTDCDEVEWDSTGADETELRGVLSDALGSRDALAARPAPAAAPAVLDEWAALAREFAQLRAEAAERRVPADLTRRLDALGRELDVLRQDSRELAALLDALERIPDARSFPIR